MFFPLYTHFWVILKWIRDCVVSYKLWFRLTGITQQDKIKILVKFQFNPNQNRCLSKIVNLFFDRPPFHPRLSLSVYIKDSILIFTFTINNSRQSIAGSILKYKTAKSPIPPFTMRRETLLTTSKPCILFNGFVNISTSFSLDRGVSVSGHTIYIL